MPEPEPTDATPDTQGTPARVRSRRPWHGRSILAMAVEVALIGLGVFLGLAGEQWRQSREHRAEALESLRRFRAEIVSNRSDVATKLDNHRPLQKDVAAFLAADPKGREAITLKFSGLQPPFFEQTAWDLAIATQSLAYLGPGIAFAISRIYTTQALLMDLGRGMTQAMYLTPPRENFEAFLGIVDLYYGDLVGIEPLLLEQYDDILPQIDAALAD